jgi:hypothetical protein
MAQNTITFPAQLNISVQPTDILYTTLLTSNQSGRNHSRGNEKPIAIGRIVGVNHVLRQITYDDNGFPATAITANHYLFFSKDRRVSTSGILGYYALAEYRNHSKNEAEIFATATEYSSSSK